MPYSAAGTKASAAEKAAKEYADTKASAAKKAAKSYATSEAKYYARTIWPNGNYCILRRGDCPSGFSGGWVYIDTEDNDPQNKWSGSLPKGTYNRNNLDFYFCCK